MKGASSTATTTSTATCRFDISCGRHLLCSRLRRSNIDASAGSVEEIERIVAQIREQWPEVRIIVRGNGGFAREALTKWYKEQGVDYVFGLPRNAQLQAALEPAFEQTEALCAASGAPQRAYDE